MRLISELICVVLMAAAVWLYLASPDPDLNEWNPAEVPWIAGSPTVLPEFTARQSLEFHVFLRFKNEVVREFRRTECLSGLRAGAECSAFPEALQAAWKVEHRGQSLASGDAAKPGGYIQSRRFFRDLGSFKAEAGQSYRARVEWIAPDERLTKLEPTVVIATYPSQWEGVMNQARVKRAFAQGMGVIGLTMLWVSLALRFISYMRRKGERAV